MDKVLNNISVMTGLVGGFLIFILGGFDTMLVTLITLVVIDYISGLIKAIINKDISSEIGFKGIFKKIFVFLIVALSVSVQNIIGNSIPLREIVIVFYITNEGISILENAGEILPIPIKLKEILLQLRDKNSKGDDKN